MTAQDMSINDCIQQLTSEYDVVDIIDCDAYGDNWIDLYLKFKTIHKTEYQPNERIIIKSCYDFYTVDRAYGKLLKSIQLIVNDIDISNFFICFVTTNQNIDNEYKIVLDTYSVDSIPFSLYICNGNYNKKLGEDIHSFSKMQSLNEYFETVSSLTDEEKFFLFESKTFCIAPWTSLMIDPDNKVRPCCEYKGTIGDASKLSLEEIWNSPESQNIRTKMIKNQSLTGCQKCYIQEKYGRDSLRNSLNRRFSNHVSKLKQTDNNGYIDNFELVYLDSRFNNLCNLSCRSCTHSYSSSWHKPAVQLKLIAKDTPVFLTAGRHKKDLLDQICNHIDSLESIYFAGGEPLIIEDFYSILDELDKNGRHDIKLIYNTNLTKTGIKNKSIFDAWKNFKNIFIGASLDAEGSRGEYLRSGTKWKDVVAFRKDIINLRPDIDFSINATTSMINALHVPDFHRSWVEQELITPEQFNIQLLFDPEYMRLDTAPIKLKEKIREKYENHLNWLRPRDQLGRATYGFESIIKQLDTDNQFDRKLFWDNVNSLDNYYNTDLLSVFPELEDLK